MSSKIIGWVALVLEVILVLLMLVLLLVVLFLLALLVLELFPFLRRIDLYGSVVTEREGVEEGKEGEGCFHSSCHCSVVLSV